jgi:hypothetical protein
MSNSDSTQNEKKEKELQRLIRGTETPAEEREEEREASIKQ